MCRSDPDHSVRKKRSSSGSVRSLWAATVSDRDGTCHVRPAEVLLSPTLGAKALLVLPDSRPRLAELVDAAPAAGFTCTVERLVPSPRLRRRLGDAHDGWGANGAGFSLYTLERCAVV